MQGGGAYAAHVSVNTAKSGGAISIEVFDSTMEALQFQQVGSGKNPAVVRSMIGLIHGDNKNMEEYT